MKKNKKELRKKAKKININNHAVNLDRDEINVEHETILDIVGTGGDGTYRLVATIGQACVGRMASPQHVHVVGFLASGASVVSAVRLSRQP